LRVRIPGDLMARGAAKFASAILACAFAIAPIVAKAQNAVDFPPDPPATPDKAEKPEKAVDDCLTAPSGEAPSAQRWVYRIERGSQRHCWYLRDKSEQRASQPTPSIAAAAKPIAAAPGAAMQSRPNTDARAELPTARGRFESDNPLGLRTPPAAFGSRTPPITAADDDVRGPQGMSRMPQPLDTFSAPPPAAADSSVADANDTGADPAQNLGTSTAPALAASADASPRPDAAPPKASLQRLLVAIFGALAFAGVTASLIHRFAFIWRKRNARLRRRTLWQSAKKARTRPPQAASAPASSVQAPNVQAASVQAPTVQAPSAQAAGAQNVAANQARGDMRNRQDDDAQGQIEELLGRVAQRVKHEAPVPALAKLANSQAAAVASARRSSAPRGARA
jgi:hypothetical protein